MELRLGFMSYPEIAEWFGMKRGSFNNKKKEKMQILKEYADYIIVNNKGIEIKQIYIPVYTKKSNSKAYEIVKQDFDNIWGKDSIDPNFDTCRIVANKISDNHKELEVKNDTIYKYVINVRTQKYGHPCVEDRGVQGSCYSTWGIKEINDDGAAYARPLTAEQIKVKNQLLRKYFGANEHQVQNIEKELLVHSLVDSGEISKDKAYDILVKVRKFNKENYTLFLRELRSELGADIVRGTVLEKDNQPLAIEWTGV